MEQKCKLVDEATINRKKRGRLTPMSAPSFRAESFLHVILWSWGNFPDLWPSKNKMLLVNASA